MDYNKIQTFIVVAELGSVTEAARRLQRSQSAISQQIQALEAELELQLLERKAGKILLSRDGEELYRIAKNRLAQIGDEVQTLQKTKVLVEGCIRIGILDDYANEFEIGTTLASFCNEHPKVSVAVTYGTSASLELDLIANRIDLAFFVFFSQAEFFVRYPVSKTRHNLYASAGYLKQHGHVRTYADILKADLLDLHQDFTTMSRWFQKNAPQLLSSLRHRQPNLTAPNHKMLKQIVDAGFGMAILPDYLVKASGHSSRCVRVMTSAKAITSGLDLAFRTNKTLRLSERLLVDKIRSVAIQNLID